MSSVWRYLQEIKASDLKGSEIQKAASFVYLDPQAQGDLAQLRSVSDTADLFAFKGGVGWPDSVSLYGATFVAGESATAIKASTLYDGEGDASDYLIRLLAISGEGVSGDAQVALNLTDGATTLGLGRHTATNGLQTPLFPAQASGTGYVFPYLPLTEDVYITVGATSNNATLAFLSIITSRGGNPQ